ncbi:LytTR family DNA-binding domain-containing protein [uncultured Ruminococcus sp.]|uniref:LytR/AlgR family response regulator transcription factor n=1 Tax=uncultured Ruminococcus sp. TaxID=165186 RepID=UPI002636AE95|nr:LytTR family DNA-binding domain-containing protein [uncultured Ruminococcus sp.]
MRIAIADDDASMCQRIREYLLIYSTQKDVDMDPPDIYTDCESLYQACLNGVHYDFLFLDIDFSGCGKMPDFFQNRFQDGDEQMNGITLGIRLRRIVGLKDVDIIFVTSYDHCAAATISNIRPAGFIKKPASLEEISDTMQKAIQYRNMTHRLFEFTCRKTLMRVPVSRIQYLNSCGRQIVVKMVDGRASFYGKLSDVRQQKCFESFLNIHKSYLVNPDYIERYTTNSVYLCGPEHEVLPISRTQQSVVDDWLMRN